ncbi:MAG: (2Fe-2S) ferredoxin domain-containing protein [Candidatus Cloacimonetes bacterium]|nr:(2Fe-2S) ferredoxin domain-containing protein [Candidatus Cloacimonadota bacterium]
MKTLEELREIRAKARQNLDAGHRVKVVVSMGTASISLGAREVMKAFQDEIGKKGLNDVIVTQTGEKGLSSIEPVVDVLVKGQPCVIYGHMNVEKVRRVVTEHIIGGKIVDDIVAATV